MQFPEKNMTLETSDESDKNLALKSYSSQPQHDRLLRRMTLFHICRLHLKNRVNNSDPLRCNGFEFKKLNRKLNFFVNKYT